MKVWNRYTPRMFLPHCMDPGSGNFRAVEDGVSMSRYYQLLEEEEIQEQDQSLDSYDRFFSMARMEYRQGRFSERTQQQIVESTMTKDPRLQEMIKEYFDPRIIFSCGTGWQEAAPSEERLWNAAGEKDRADQASMGKKVSGTP